ncbi:MAG: response regulator [Bacteroidales bacterium]|nr:response regulator [Bacteroidales bacterium]
MNKSTDKERIQKLIEVVMKVAQGDYSVQNELSENNDDLDALAMGLNMMIDDLRNNVDLEEQNKKFKAINVELKKAKEKAQESDRLKSAFLTNMSHEIRTPMNAILGFSAILKRGDKSEEKNKKYLSHIESAGKHLLELIEDIIDLSKIESRQLKINKKHYCISDLLDEVFEITEQDDKLKLKPNLKLVLKNSPDFKNCFIYTDQLRFKQIFINLIHNAIKFTEKGYVEVGASLNNENGKNTVTFYVKDTGIGIHKDLHEIIFERFRQANTEQYLEGTGLGLSITRGLVNKLDGKIWLESAVGKGTTFYVSFPYSINQIKPDKKTDRNPKTEKFQNLSEFTIYIAEDELVSLFLLEEILKPYGAKIKHAQNGSELLELIETEKPDLVLLDFHMPVMNGYETIKEIRKRNYTFPVVAQTSYAMIDDQKAILKAGCNGYISKPLDPDKIIQEIVKHLNINS